MGDLLELKPLDEAADKLLKSGYSLVHMLEKVDFFDYNQKNWLNKYTYSSGDGIFFKKLPCSQIKNDVPMRLFFFPGYSYSIGSCNAGTGILFDARDVDFLYTAPNLIFNSEDIGSLVATKRSVFQETDEMQGVKHQEISPGYFDIPQHTGAEINKKALEVIDRSWELIANSHEDFYKRTYGMDPGNAMVTESLVNLKSVKDIKAIVYHAEEAPEIIPLDGMERGGFFNALLLKGYLAREFDHNVPILFYKKVEGRNFDDPEIAEVKLDKKIVKEAIKESQRLYQPFLYEYSEAALGVKFDKKNIPLDNEITLTGPESDIIHDLIKELIARQKKAGRVTS